jgi:hypothetical protein
MRRFLNKFLGSLCSPFRLSPTSRSLNSTPKYSFQFAHWLFGRALGLICLFAFASYWIQAEALIGPVGINPWEKDLALIEGLPAIQENITSKWTLRPTLLWVEPFANHDLLFALGTLSALLLMIGIIPAVSAMIAYITYLSVMVVGDPFLSFQWDILLLETLLLSLPFLPVTRLHKLSNCYPISTIGRFLLVALLAKLMLESGLVKFTFFAGDGSNRWHDLSALNFHYWTQPLPHPLSPWVHSLPNWFDQFSLLTMYAVELLFPFFLFLPGIWRRVGVTGQIILQVSILLSGNYGFFNLLTLCLCIPLLDDQLLPSFLQKKLQTSKTSQKKSFLVFREGFACILAFVFAATTVGHLVRDARGNQPASDNHWAVPGWVQDLQVKVRPFHCFNSYGLFRVMTITRPEIIIEGSPDGKAWETYEFAWKPSHENQALRFAGPHMPRIDWQMWFEGLNFENYASHPFSRFLYGRFLQMMVDGENDKIFSNLPKILGPGEFQAIQQATPAVQKQFLSNYNHLIQSFLARSKWFGSFLHALGEEHDGVLEKLSATNPVSFTPHYLRVTLKHFKFSEKKGQVWEIQDIPDATYIFSVGNWTKAKHEKP